VNKSFSQLLLGVLLAAAVWQSSNARAASFKPTTDPNKTCSAIQIEGEIQPGDYDRFASTLKQARMLAPLRRLYLNSSGGDLLTTLAIIELVRNIAPTAETIVQSRHICNSACVIILAAGNRRNVSTDSRLKIHQVSNEKTKEQDTEMTRKIGEYMASKGMPREVVRTMSNLKAKEELTITPSNAKRLGFGSFNFYGSTNPPATPQCTWEGFILRDP
jgi:hypothetical protein